MGWRKFDLARPLRAIIVLLDVVYCDVCQRLFGRGVKSSSIDDGKAELINSSIK